MALACGRLDDQLLAAGHDRNAGLLHFHPGGDLVAHERQHLAGRSDKLDARLFAGIAEAGIFGEKAVSGVDGLCAARSAVSIILLIFR